MAFSSRPLLLAAVALAVSAAGPAHPPRLLPGWAVDRAASRVSFTLKVDNQPVQGTFKRWTAQVDFDPAKPQAGKVVLNLDAGSLVTGTPARDMALIGPGGLAAAHAARVVFTSRTIAAAPNGAFQALGEIRGRDGAHPTTFTFHLVTVDGAQQIDGEAPMPLAWFSPASQPRATQATLAVRLAARGS